MLALSAHSTLGLPGASTQTQALHASGAPFLNHIPKTGGTAMEDVAEDAGIKWGILSEVWPEKRPVQCSAWHIPPALWAAKGGEDPYAGKSTFCAVRHPYTRIASEFVWRAALEKGCEYPTSEERCLEAAGDPAEWCNPQVLNAKIKSTLGPIVNDLRKLTPSVDDSMNRVAPLWDCHLLPQWLYTQQSCDHVLRYENITSEFHALFAGEGAPYDMPQLADVNLGAMQANNVPCSLRVGDLDEGSRELIKEAYAKDFEKFDYDGRLINSAHARALQSRATHLVSVPESELVING